MSGTFNTGPEDRITECSTKFCNSRIFPGHEWRVSASIVSEGMVSIKSVHPAGKMLYEVPHQQWNVFGPIAQRRHLNGEDVEPVVQI